jgi:histidinol-phosphate/aromatic aminotransferase/cobyric acid decarboxylase-like protein
LYLIPRACGKKRAVITAPAYADYASACELAGVLVEKFILKEEEGFSLNTAALEEFIEKDDLVFIGRPNNPTGLSVDFHALTKLAHQHPEALFVIDEAFADFVDGPDHMSRFVSKGL